MARDVRALRKKFFQKGYQNTVKILYYLQRKFCSSSLIGAAGSIDGFSAESQGCH